jgi:hypothetical protein
MQPTLTSVGGVRQSRASAVALDGRTSTLDGRDARTRVLLEGPIATTLVTLAAPNLLVNIAQSTIGLIETYFVGRLGTDALAGVAPVFPVVMLVQMGDLIRPFASCIRTFVLLRRRRSLHGFRAYAGLARSNTHEIWVRSVPTSGCTCRLAPAADRTRCASPD